MTLTGPKMLIALLRVNLLAALFVAAAFATLFDVSIVRCGSAGTSSACGSNPAASDPLRSGKVIGDGPQVEVELKGAAPNSTYRVFVGNWVAGGAFQPQFSGTGVSGSIGSITTDADGNFFGPIKTDSGAKFGFPVGTVISQPNFAFSSSDGTTQFSTGIKTTDGILKRVLPHFAAGGSFFTGIYVVNKSSQPETFSISFNDDTGKPVSLSLNGLSASAKLSDTIAGNGRKYYETGNPQGPLSAGSAVIVSTSSIAIQALFNRHASDGSYYEAAVPATSGGNEFDIPFDATTFAGNGAQIYTGIAIANLSSLSPANVVCTARDSQGNIIPNAVLVPTLAPSGHWANYLFPALTGKSGTLNCTSNIRVGAMGLRALGANAISSLPVFYIR